MTEVKHTTELIPVDQHIINQDIVSTVDARKLHEFLGVKTAFNDWISRRISTYGFVQDIDFCVLTSEYGPITTKEYHLTFDMAKELSMVERTPKGKEARQYFLSCEKALQQLATPQPVLHPITMEYLRDHKAFLEELGQYNDRDAMMLADIVRTKLAQTKYPSAVPALPGPASFDTEDILREVAPSLNATQIRSLTGVIGKVLANGWRTFHPGEIIKKHDRWIDGKARAVNCYPMQDMAWACPLVHEYLRGHVPYFKD